MSVEMRPEEPGDRNAVWEILEAVIRAGETFMNDPASTRDEVDTYWRAPGTHNYVAETGGEVVGACLIRPTQPGLGSHIANASFAVSPRARGQGTGRRMGEFAIAEAARLGFRAMQFNAVVSTNTGAIRLWESLGFETVGRIPGAFRMPDGLCVDTLVMYRRLG